MAKALTADDLWELLKTRYSGERDEWVILSEVRNRAGYDASRSADAIAMNRAAGSASTASRSR
jgi:hypothetical protein